jgi:hypothetical protein
MWETSKDSKQSILLYVYNQSDTRRVFTKYKLQSKQYNQNDTGKVFTIKIDIKTPMSYVYQCKYGSKTESAERKRCS